MIAIRFAAPLAACALAAHADDPGAAPGTGRDA